MTDLREIYTTLFEEFGGDQSSEEECDHEDIFEDSGSRICRDCGLVDEILDFEPEWRNYGGDKNSSRCCSVKGNIWSIEKDFEKWNIDVPAAIRIQTETRYIEIMKMIKEKKDKKSGRGRGRKAIIAACLLFVFRKEGDYRTFDELKDMFQLTKKNMFNGLTSYFETFKDDRVVYISPEDLIHRVLVMTGVDQSHYSNIVRITRALENTSKILNRSKPSSVASAVVYYYLCLNPSYKEELGLTKASFAERAKLSDITITKHVKEISKVCKISVKV